MNRDESLYSGLLHAIGQRSLPPNLKNCIPEKLFALSDCEPFRSASPFPHIVLDDFLTPGFCQKLLSEFPLFHPQFAVDENGSIGGKATHSDIRSIGPAYTDLDALIQSRAFLDLMTAITGIPDLLYDPDYLGGGTHENLDGQLLDFHVDFNYHHKKRWHRRINLILFLNEQWDDDWGGCLELRESPCVPGDVRVSPGFNRAVIFQTSEISWHGFSKIALPHGSNLSRKSVALYFYTRDQPAEEKALPRSTVYVEEFLPAHLDEGHTLNSEDMAILRSLLDRRDSHIARLYQHERELTTRVFELEGQADPRKRGRLKTLNDFINSKLRGLRRRLSEPTKPAASGAYPYIQFSRLRDRSKLIDGWGETESSMVWSLGRFSLIELDFQSCTDLDLHFECRPFNYPNAPVQSVSVYLNDVFQATVELSNQKKTYSLRLAHTDQQAGINRLKFEYGYAISPKSLGNVEDDRELAVAWFNLWITELA